MGKTATHLSDQQLVNQLKQLEPVIASEARSFARSVRQHDVDDLQQIGRMAVMNVIASESEQHDQAYTILKRIDDCFIRVVCLYVCGRYPFTRVIDQWYFGEVNVLTG